MASTHKQVFFCEKCQRPFGVVEKRGSYGQDEPEPINCTHCGHVHSRANTNGVFQNVELTDEEERQALRQRNSA
jgi:DNA-directed RNA polymerase subunit RPC12/RpoP